jgi:hypothetical protein
LIFYRGGVFALFFSRFAQKINSGVFCMKKYQKVQISIVPYANNDVLAGSNNGIYEGVSDLKSNSDWFLG